jgi:hypothetical protein
VRGGGVGTKGGALGHCAVSRRRGAFSPLSVRLEILSWRTHLVFIQSAAGQKPFFGCCFCGHFETTVYHNHHKCNIPARQAPPWKRAVRLFGHQYESGPFEKLFSFLPFQAQPAGNVARAARDKTKEYAPSCTCPIKGAKRRKKWGFCRVCSANATE